MTTTLKGRVTGISRPGTGLCILHITPDDPHLTDYSAGQYVMLSAGGHDFRPYSIACAPHQGHIELHIRDQGGGLSHYAVTTLKENEEVLLQGPFGLRFSLPAQRPLLMVAGGVGISPVKAILETTLAASPDQIIKIFWGVRDKTHLYLDDYFKKQAKEACGFTYHPVIGNGMADALIADNGTLENTTIYMAGPGPMIDAVMPALLQKKAQKDYIFSDAFTL